MHHFSGTWTPKLLSCSGPEKISKEQFSLIIYNGCKLSYAKLIYSACLLCAGKKDSIISSVNYVFQNRGINSKNVVIKPCLTWERKSLASNCSPRNRTLCLIKRCDEHRSGGRLHCTVTVSQMFCLRSYWVTHLEQSSGTGINGKRHDAWPAANSSKHFTVKVVALL